MGEGIHRSCISFISKLFFENNIIKELGLDGIILPVKDCRNIGKKDMKLNDKTQELIVDPEIY